MRKVIEAIFLILICSSLFGKTQLPVKEYNNMSLFAGAWSERLQSWVGLTHVEFLLVSEKNDTIKGVLTGSSDPIIPHLESGVKWKGSFIRKGYKTVDTLFTIPAPVPLSPNSPLKMDPRWFLSIHMEPEDEDVFLRD